MQRIFRAILALGVLSGPFTIHAASEYETVFFQMDYIYNAQFAGHIVALEEGYYTDEGLFVITATGTSTNPTMVERVVDLQYAIGSTHSFDLIRAVGDGAPVKTVGTMFQYYPNGWIYLKDGAFKGVESFDDVKVGLHSKESAFDKMLVSLAGYSMDDLDIMVLPEVPHDPDRVLKGEVDVMTGYLVEEYVTLNMKSGGKAKIILFNDTGYEGYGQMIFTTDRMIAERPATVAAFMRAQKKGWDKALAEPAATAKMINEVYSPNLDPDQMEAALIAMEDLVAPGEGPSFVPVDKKRFRKAMNILVEYGMLNRAFPVDMLVDNRFNP